MGLIGRLLRVWFGFLEKFRTCVCKSGLNIKEQRVIDVGCALQSATLAELLASIVWRKETDFRKRKSFLRGSWIRKIALMLDTFLFYIVLNGFSTCMKSCWQF